MSLNVGRLSAILDLDDRRFRAGLAGASSSLQKTGQQVSSFGRGMTYGVTLPLIGIGTQAVRTAAEFQSSMNAMAAVAGVPAPKLEKLKALAIELGAKTAVSANEAAGAMLELSKAGISVSQIMGGALENTIDLAIAGQLDLAQAATITSNAMNVFGLSGKQSKVAVDALAGAANASSADVDDLALALQMGGNAAAAAGMTIQETTGVLAALADQGIRGSDAGTSFKTMLLNLVPTSVKAKETMKELGVSFVNANGSIKSISQVAEVLQGRLGGLTQAQQQAALKVMFGTDAYRASRIVMNEGAEGLARYIEKTSEAGTTSEVAAARMKGLPGALEKLKGAVETALLVIGDRLAPTIEKVAGFLTELMDRFTKLPVGVQETIIAIAALVAALGPLLWIGGKLLSPIGRLAGLLLSVGTAAGTAGTGVAGAAGKTGLLTGAFGALKGMGLGTAGALGTMGLAAAAAGVAVYAWSKAIGEARNTSRLMHEAVMANVPLLDAYADATDRGYHSGQDLARMVRIQIQNARDSGASQEDLNAIIERGNQLLATYNARTRELAEKYRLTGTAAETFRRMTEGVDGVTKKHQETIAGLINKMDSYDLALNAATASKVRAAMEAGKFGEALDILQGTVRRAVGTVNTEIRKIPANMRSEGARSREMARALGLGISSGMAAGIRAGKSEVINAAADMAISALTKAKHLLAVKSPSKVFERIGEMTAEGFTLGIRRGTGRAVGAVERLATAVSNAAENLKGAARRQFEELGRMGDRLADKLGRIQDRIDDFKSSVKDSFRSVTDIVAKFSGGDLGEMTHAQRVNAIRDEMFLRLERAQHWAQTLKRLQAAGLNQGLLRQFISEGPGSMDFAQTLLSADLVGFANRMTSQINEAIEGVTNNLTHNVFGDEMRAAREELNDFANAVSVAAAALREADFTKDYLKDLRQAARSGAGL